MVLLLGAWLALTAVRGLDLNVYHKMLRGAVTFGEDFEENYMKQIFDLEKGMTQAVSHFSRYKDADKKKTKSGKYEYTGSCEITAEDKIKQFYKHTTQFLLFGSLALFLFTNANDWVEEYINQDTAASPNSEVGAETSNSDTNAKKSDE